MEQAVSKLFGEVNKNHLLLKNYLWETCLFGINYEFMNGSVKPAQLSVSV